MRAATTAPRRKRAPTSLRRRTRRSARTLPLAAGSETGRSTCPSRGPSGGGGGAASTGLTATAALRRRVARGRAARGRAAAGPGAPRPGAGAAAGARTPCGC
eukprot:14248464-Alexandrium_andersonii.AAC.1